jgi:prepilin-type N-terminal cleavage/methylation domain-containing protein/prepilin-type processing-associated H-X9-DG protein
MHQSRKRAFTLIELLVVVAILAVLAALLFPVFANARDKARQAACFSNLKQIGYALHMYVQDYDDHLPTCCSWARVGTLQDLTGRCRQDGITSATPKDTYLGPEQTPPRYIQELLDPYVKNAQIWFCPSVGRDRHWLRDPTSPTYGYNGTTYWWSWYADPTLSTDPNPFRKRDTIMVSGLAIAAIPRPTEAAVIFEAPFRNPVEEPCASLNLRPAHAKGLNVLYADTHVRFSPFSGRVTPADPAGTCMENWAYEHSWEGYYE